MEQNHGLTSMDFARADGAWAARVRGEAAGGCTPRLHLLAAVCFHVRRAVRVDPQPEAASSSRSRKEPAVGAGCREMALAVQPLAR